MALSSAESTPTNNGGGRSFGGSDLDILSSNAWDPNYTAEISNKMRVPKKIRVVGGENADGGDGYHSSDESATGWGGGGFGGGPGNRHSYHGGRSEDDRARMQVPDRIMVTGHERHVGAKALPRELQLDAVGVVMPPDPELIRVQTPPRSIRLQEGGMGRRGNKMLNGGLDYDGEEEDDETLIVESAGGGNPAVLMNGDGMVDVYEPSHSLAIARRGKRSVTIGDDGDDGRYLRDQVNRLNGRIVALEIDSAERKEKERYVVLAGLIYLAYKTCAWLFRTSPH